MSDKPKCARADCSACHGTGMMFPDCDECNGYGWVPDPRDGGTKTCPKCDGAECEQCEF